MLNFYTETRTFIGEKTSQAGSGYAGFIVGATYQLHFARLGNGTVAIEPRSSPSAKRIVISERLFERWWVKKTEVEQLQYAV